MYAFVAFLSFSGLMILFFNGSKYKDQYREDRPITGPMLTGVGSGFLSGLLGVAGGYLGTIVMQKNMRPAAVRKFLGGVLLLLAVRMIQKMLL